MDLPVPEKSVDSAVVRDGFLFIMENILIT